ncbi:MAG: DUF5989 family protein [Candidatus Nanohaloarchaea archaeon]|nr:DUF5989 family protein [Candidatus Nanohaloarchaea archaeon]
MNRVRRRAARIRENLGVVGEFLGFLWDRKIYWMIPIFLMLITIGALVIFAQSSALSPFVYTLV